MNLCRIVLGLGGLALTLAGVVLLAVVVVVADALSQLSSSLEYSLASCRWACLGFSAQNDFDTVVRAPHLGLLFAVPVDISKKPKVGTLFWVLSTVPGA